VTKSLSPLAFQEFQNALANTPTPFHFAENRVPLLLERRHALPQLSWHFIGNLQSNKIHKLPPLTLIHSVSSQTLLEKLDRHYQKLKHPQEVLLQLNLTQEPTKQGFSPQTLEKLWTTPLDLQALRVVGLMTMAKQSENPQESRLPFRRLKHYFESWRSVRTPWLNLQFLSMGMSQDYEVAIEEGATHLRIGSFLFQ
jgi:pyridoxal phosphate enzyme (YggS family)